ncbi:hypothetical protein [Bacterioplanoides sp.]|uniref:hypothetical protein n=1 Tax=Bacterioplanoides sp. TaxID=2066072 RepID=UPI003B58BAD4
MLLNISRSLLLICCALILPSHAGNFLPGTFPDYSTLNFVPYTEGKLPADSYQTLPSEMRRKIKVYAIKLPDIEDGMDFTLNSIAIDDEIFAATVTILDEDFIPIDFSGIGDNLSVCDKRIEHHMELSVRARYMIIAPSGYVYADSKGSICTSWVIDRRVIVLPVPTYKSIKLTGTDQSALDISLSKPWFTRNRIFWHTEIESPGRHLSGSRNDRQPEVPSSVNTFLGVDAPVNEHWFVKFKAGARVTLLNNQSHKGFILNTGLGYRLDKNWHLISSLNFDIKRKQRYFKSDYNGPNFIHYKNTVGLNFSTEYHINRNWHAEAALNLTELETKQGVKVPANSIKLGLSYYFN